LVQCTVHEAAAAGAFCVSICIPRPFGKRIDAPRYTIKTLKDMGQIPADRIDAFLVDLRSCLLTAHGISDITDSFVKAVDPAVACDCMVESLVWIDDGANDLLGLHLEDDQDMLHGHPVKHEQIGSMVDGMHQFARLIRDNNPQAE